MEARENRLTIRELIMLIIMILAAILGILNIIDMHKLLSTPP
jgi:hypothetical protein